MFLTIFICLIYIRFSFAVAVTKLQNLNGGTNLKRLNDTRSHVCVSDLSTYRCDFSDPCPFGPSTDSPWYELKGYPDYNLWQQAVGTPVSADPPSLGVQLGGDIPFGILTSDVMPCVSSDASLSFKFWSTKNVMLSVCLVSKSSESDIFCNNQFAQGTNLYPGPITIDIPKAIDEPFMIRFMASTAPGVEGFLILDDIYFYGSLCDNPPLSACNGNGNGNGSQKGNSTIRPLLVSTTTKRGTVATSKPVVTATTKKITTTTTKPAVLSTNMCLTVPCNFTSSMCNYVASNTGTAMWARDNTRLTNDLVDTVETWWNNVFCKQAEGCNPDQGYYMAADVGNQNDIAVVSSPQFAPSNNKQLSFKYFRSIGGHTIKICFETNYVPAFPDLNSAKQCQYAIPPINWLTAGIWNTATYRIPNSATKFHLVALHEGFFAINGPVAVDDITVIGC